MAKKAVPTGEHAALLLSVGKRQCYRPECPRPLVVVRDDHRIVDFEVAHIRDELSPPDPNADIGWRYWPDNLSQEDRNRYGNLLLLCPPCHKLVDKIRPRDFSVELLHEWKRDAEAGDPTIIEVLRTERFDPAQLVAALCDVLQAETPVRLQLPGLLTPDGLSFASRSTTFTGRDDELGRIGAFLASSESFSWWVVVGPAGMGKSRLALEACHEASHDWDVGFISDADQAALLHFVPERPTLLVVDYAASRAQWLAQLLAGLAEQAKSDGPSVRLLILERDTSPSWFDVATLRARHHLSVRILSTQYAEPLSLGGLNRDETRELVRFDAEVSGQDLNTTDIEDIVDRAFELDPVGRPLFTLIACIEHREPAGLRRSRDHLLRRLIERRHSQDGAESAAIGRRAMALTATALGGTSVSEILRLRQTGTFAAVLADPAMMGAADLDRLLPGLVPDMLGELWVLDENLAEGSAGEIGTLALRAAWSLSPQRYAAFVQRTLRDHPTHAAIVKLFNVDRPEDEATWFRMCANAVPYLGWPTSPVVAELIRLIEACEPGPLRDEALAGAAFAVANLYLNTGDPAAAVQGYTSVIESAPPNSEVRWQAYTNRGVVAINTGQTHIAKDDWNAVIEAQNASDESRACCLNNRADFYSSQEDHEAAISDRTAVLSLRETSYNRRYIALIRRSSSKWHLRRVHEAFEDIEVILATEDIVTEQKMAARLQRVEWMLLASDQIPEVGVAANEELRVIVASRRNFPQTELQARELLSRGNLPSIDPSERAAPKRLPNLSPFAPVRGPL